VEGVLNVFSNKVTEELGIPLRKVTDKMLGLSDTGENVFKTFYLPKTAMFYTNSS
jgi:hypothetical protein